MPTDQIRIHAGQPVRVSSLLGIRVREDSAFTDRLGVEKRGVRKRAGQALERLQEPLRRFLEPDEAVLFIGRGQRRPSGFEQFLLGLHAYYFAPAALVVTNRRLLHLLVTWNGTWKRSLRSVPWDDIEEGAVKGLQSPKLHLKHRDGKKEVYWRIRADDAKKIRVLVATLIPAAQREPSPGLSTANLCPDCRAGLRPGVYECPHCLLRFIDPKTLIRRALLIPGGGFFYTGHALLGLVHSLAEAFLFLDLTLSVLVATGVLGLGAGETSLARTPSFAMVVLFATLLVIHKWIMIRISASLVRDFIPVS